MTGTPQIMAQLLYGSGLRLTECLRLRIKDIDFQMHQIKVRDGKGAVDRVAVLPTTVHAALQAHLVLLKQTHERALTRGGGAVSLPFALEEKYPNAPTAWAWQYVFPASHDSTDPRSGRIRRHHLDESVLQKR